MVAWVVILTSIRKSWSLYLNSVWQVLKQVNAIILLCKHFLSFSLFKFIESHFRTLLKTMYQIHGVTSKNEYCTYISPSFLLVVLSCFQLDNLFKYCNDYKESGFNEVTLQNLRFHDLIAIILFSKEANLNLVIIWLLLHIDAIKYKNIISIDTRVVLAKMEREHSVLFMEVIKAIKGSCICIK